MVNRRIPEDAYSDTYRNGTDGAVPVLSDREANVLREVVNDQLSAVGAVNRSFSRICAVLTDQIHDHLGPIQSRLPCPLQC